MSTEAIDIETPAPVVDTAPAVDETPAVETKPEVTPEVTPEATPEPAGPTDVDIYQEILAKDVANPGYEMTDDELEIFTSVSDDVMSGKIKEPGLKDSAVTPIETPEKAEKPEEAEAETPKETATDAPDITVKQGDSIQESMAKLGAKDVNELPAKIDLLLKGWKESGGKLGTANVALQKQVDQNVNFMQAIRAGDPQALAYFNKVTGQKVQGQDAVPVPEKNAQIADLPDDFDPENFLDNKLAPIVQNLVKDMKSLQAENQQLKAKDSGRDRATLQTEAVTAWVDDVVRMVDQNPEDFGMTRAEARGLAIKYWSPAGVKAPIHPSFQKMHDLITYSADNSMPDLDTAHIALQQKNGSFAQKLIDAEKRGEKKASHIEAPNLAISAKQGRTKNSVPEPNVTEDMVSAMAGGDLNAIPDSVLEQWTDDNYTFVKSQIPERFHSAIFGGGKI